MMAQNGWNSEDEGGVGGGVTGRKAGKGMRAHTAEGGI